MPRELYPLAYRTAACQALEDLFSQAAMIDAPAQAGPITLRFVRNSGTGPHCHASASIKLLLDASVRIGPDADSELLAPPRKAY